MVDDALSRFFSLNTSPFCPPEEKTYSAFFSFFPDRGGMLSFPFPRSKATKEELTSLDVPFWIFFPHRLFTASKAISLFQPLLSLFFLKQN